MHVVEVGQYFVTKDTGDFRQRIHPETMELLNQKGGSKET